QTDFTTLRNVGVGLNSAAVDAARQAGLQPVGRITNFEGVAPAKIDAILARLKGQGIKTVVFQGTEVLGYRGLDKETAAALDANGINFGMIEFGKQKGEEQIGTSLESRYVRVHSFSEIELGSLNDDDNIDRYDRA